MIQAFAQAVIEHLREDLAGEYSKPSRDIAWAEPGQTPTVAVSTEDITFVQGQQRIPLVPTAGGVAVQRDFTGVLAICIGGDDPGETERRAGLALASIALAPDLLAAANRHAAAMQQSTGIRATQTFKSFRILDGSREDTAEATLRSYRIEVAGVAVFERIGLDLGEVIKKVRIDRIDGAPEVSEPPAPSIPAWVEAVNTATLDELDAVSGIGVATANKIMAGRPFETEDELRAADGMTTRRYDSLKAHFLG